MFTIYDIKQKSSRLTYIKRYIDSICELICSDGHAPLFVMFILATK